MLTEALSNDMLEDDTLEKDTLGKDTLGKVTPLTHTALKRSIAQGFDKAAQSYDQQADLQHQVAGCLCQWSQRQRTIEAEHAADLGSGTGQLYRMLGKTLSAQSWMNVDISHAMLKRARQLTRQHSLQDQPAYIVGDAEALPLASNSVDLVCSSMALQWCSSPQKVLEQIHRVLKPGGRALLATMVAPSFSNLHEAWQQIGLHSRVNSFEANKTWQNALDATAFNASFTRKRFYTEHTSVLNMLRSIKGVGADTRLASGFEPHNTKMNSNKITRAELYELSKCLKLKDSAGPYVLNYDILFLDLSANKR